MAMRFAICTVPLQTVLGGINLISATICYSTLSFIHSSL
jgi:hypothetical protein